MSWFTLAIGAGLALAGLVSFLPQYGAIFARWASSHPIPVALGLLASTIGIFQATGCPSRIGSRQDVNCNFCDTSGRVEQESGIVPCPICKGHGHITTDRFSQPRCRFCDGSARDPRSEAPLPCEVCNGIGLEPLAKSDQPVSSWTLSWWPQARNVTRRPSLNR